MVFTYQLISDWILFFLVKFLICGQCFGSCWMHLIWLCAVFLPWVSLSLSWSTSVWVVCSSFSSVEICIFFSDFGCCILSGELMYPSVEMWIANYPFQAIFLLSKFVWTVAVFCERCLIIMHLMLLLGSNYLCLFCLLSLGDQVSFNLSIRICVLIKFWVVLVLYLSFVWHIVKV